MPPTGSNPLRAGLPRDRAPEPATLVIFGVTGDLAGRKLIPALERLHSGGALPASFAIVGVGRRDWGDAGLREAADRAVRQARGSAAAADFLARFHYVTGDFDDSTLYPRLGERLAEVEADRRGAANRLFYLATPPEAFGPILEGLSSAGLAAREARRAPWARVIVEKPFGDDLASAVRLNDLVARTFDEAQIYRIDHYLGKETVQNILVFRFGNGIFEPLWNRKYIDHVQVTVAEEVGVEGRAGYYDDAGVVRDMLQNHLLQLVALVAMEPPSAFLGEAVRDEKVKVLKALEPLSARDIGRSVLRARYRAGAIGGRAVPGYLEEEGVPAASRTETWLAVRATLDNWRWAGVPFYLRSGKRMPRRASEVAIQFRDPPTRFFPQAGPEALAPNVLTLRIQPDEGIAIRFGAKVPGPEVRVQPVKMDFRYGSAFGTDSPDAYERLLLDALLGESTLFIRRDEVEAAWNWVGSILEAFADSDGPPLLEYEAGRWGPPGADTWMAGEGRAWRRL
jgi:glucose-6-phosphate 1-dehydrogenase